MSSLTSKIRHYKAKNLLNTYLSNPNPKPSLPSKHKKKKKSSSSSSSSSDDSTCDKKMYKLIIHKLQKENAKLKAKLQYLKKFSEQPGIKKLLNEIS